MASRKGSELPIDDAPDPDGRALPPEGTTSDAADDGGESIEERLIEELDRLHREIERRSRREPSLDISADDDWALGGDWFAESWDSSEPSH